MVMVKRGDVITGSGGALLTMECCKEPVTKVDELKNGEPVRYGSYGEDQTSAAQKKGPTSINKLHWSPS